MEACSSSEEWVRRLREFGHSVHSMTQLFCEWILQCGKDEGNDAKAICEAVFRLICASRDRDDCPASCVDAPSCSARIHGERSALIKWMRSLPT